MTLYRGLSLGLNLLLGVTLAKRRRADRALRESESRFRIVADSAPVLIWMSGVDRLCTFFNKPWLDFTGRTAEQEMGNGWAQGVHRDDLEGCLKNYVEAFDARRPFVLQYRLRRHDGEYRWISDNGVPRYDTQGGFAGYIGSCVDITDQLRAEAETQRLRQELAHISRVATMGEMTATIAHELSQPLTAIMTNAQAGLRFIGSPDRSRDEVSEIFNDIVVADQRARQVIQNMRALFQRAEAPRQPLRLNALINDVATVVGTDALLKSVSVTLDLAPQLPLVSGDRVQLQQVVLNLVANAFDAVSDADQPRNVLLRTRPAAPTPSRWTWSTPGRGSPSTPWCRSSSRSSPPSAAAWGWDSRSAARSWARTTAGSGRRTTRTAAPAFTWSCPPFPPTRPA